MAGKDKSFEELVKEAPAAPAEGTVSLVGTLARSGEAGKFVLTLEDGSELTLETAAVKGHEVLGTSVGQTIVRVDVEAGKMPPNSPIPVPDIIKARKDPGGETAHWRDQALVPELIRKSDLAPFALATAQQAALSTLAALQGGGAYYGAAHYVGTGWLDGLTGPISTANGPSGNRGAVCRPHRP